MTIDRDDPRLQAVAEAREAHRSERETPTPVEALGASLVNIIERIDKGIPPREYLAGARGRLAKGKRHLIVASKKTGKSITECVVTALDVIEHAAVVAILDRENGADEYARRMKSVLVARDAGEKLRRSVETRLRYHDWPRMRMDWGEDPDAYLEAFTDVDLIIFDSSRSHTAALGLKENDSDDYSAWMSALIDPLSRTGKTVVVLDNSGHEKDRARGTSSKEDLFDIVFNMTAPAPFSLGVAGRAVLECRESRIGELTRGDTWEMQLGGGHYGHWEKAGAHRPPEARDELREAVIAVLVAEGRPRGADPIAKAIRESPGNTLQVDDKHVRSALKAWAADPASGILHDPGKGYFTSGGQLHLTSPGEHPPPDPTGPTPTAPETPAATGQTAQVDTSTGPHPAESGARVPPLRGTGPTGATHNGTGESLTKRLAALPDEEAEREWERLQAEQENSA